MKIMTKKEITEKLINYLNKKGIKLKFKENSADDIILCWNYNQHYSNFTITLYLNSYGEKSKLIFKYYSTVHIEGLYRKRTSINSGFCLKIYNDLMSFKPILDQKAEEIKIATDNKIKYCTELELHYKEKHKNISISVDKFAGDFINISIYAHDDIKHHTTIQ